MTAAALLWIRLEFENTRTSRARHGGAAGILKVWTILTNATVTVLDGWLPKRKDATGSGTSTKPLSATQTFFFENENVDSRSRPMQKRLSREPIDPETSLF